jgi:hypothetical protein
MIVGVLGEVVMAIRVYWGDERQTVVCYEFNGAWSWADLHFAVDQALALQGDITHRIDVIFDMRESGRMPANPMGNFRHILERQPANVALLVFIPLKKFLVSLIQALSRFSPLMREVYRVVDTRDEALEIIAYERARCTTLNGSYKRQPDGASAQMID